jgi:hypothetical protein
MDHNTTYYWRVRAKNDGWTTEFSPVWSYTTVPPPTEYALGQNFPNPFNPATHIPYQLPAETDVSLKIYNMIGQEVMTLVEQREKAGRYDVEFNATGFASGVYFYRLKAGNFLSTKKLMILR